MSSRIKAAPPLPKSTALGASVGMGGSEWGLGGS